MTEAEQLLQQRVEVENLIRKLFSEPDYSDEKAQEEVYKKLGVDINIYNLGTIRRKMGLRKGNQGRKKSSEDGKVVKTHSTNPKKDILQKEMNPEEVTIDVIITHLKNLTILVNTYKINRDVKLREILRDL